MSRAVKVLLLDLFSDFDRLLLRLDLGLISSRGIISSAISVGVGLGEESLLFVPTGDVEDADRRRCSEGLKFLFGLSSATADPGIAGPRHKGLCK